MFQEIFTRGLIILYGATAFLDIFAYWPTIQDLYHHQKPSANHRSYSLWTITTGITFLYGIFLLQDRLFQIVSGFIFLANTIVLVLVLRLPKSH
jgi:hypothetical protein